MGDKTRAEYESIKARWQDVAGGLVEDVVQSDDAETRRYRYLTLEMTFPRDLNASLGCLMRLGTIAVQDGALLSMYVIEGEVTIRIAVSSRDLGVDAPHVVQTPTPAGVLAEERGVTPASICECGHARRQHQDDVMTGERMTCVAIHGCECIGFRAVDAGVTPDERAGFGVGGGEV